MIEQVVPDYTLLAQIGQGGYGEVYLAKSATGQYRAIKIIWRDRLGSAEAFDREFRGVNAYETVSRRHDALVDILHVGRVEDRFFYYVMDAADDARRGREFASVSYAPRTLRSELATRTALPIEQCIEIGITLASALIFLQENSLIHRDIKPENVIFIRGQLKLADVGLVADVREARSLVGTEGYVPPENHGDYPGDVYSLGKLLYEISTGRDRREFGSAPTEEADLEDPRFAAFNKIVQRAAAQNYKQRYRTARALRKDLLQLTPGGTAGGGAPKRSRRTKLWLCTFGVALVAVIALLTYDWSPPTSTQGDLPVLDAEQLTSDQNADLTEQSQKVESASGLLPVPVPPTPHTSAASEADVSTSSSASDRGNATDSQAGSEYPIVEAAPSTLSLNSSVPTASGPSVTNAIPTLVPQPAPGASSTASAPMAGDSLLASATAEAEKHQASVNALRIFLNQCPPASLLKARLIDDQGNTLDIPAASENLTGVTRLAMRIEIAVDTAGYFNRFVPGLTNVLWAAGKERKSSTWIDEPDATWNESYRNIWRREGSKAGDHHFKGEEPQAGAFMLFVRTSPAVTPGRLPLLSFELDQDSVSVVKSADRMPDLHVKLADAGGRVLVDELVDLTGEYEKGMSVVACAEGWAAVMPSFINIPGVYGELLSTYDRFVVRHDLTVEDAVLRLTRQFRLTFESNSP